MKKKELKQAALRAASRLAFCVNTHANAHNDLILIFSSIIEQELGIKNVQQYDFVDGVSLGLVFK